MAVLACIIGRSFGGKKSPVARPQPSSAVKFQSANKILPGSFVVAGRCLHGMGRISGHGFTPRDGLLMYADCPD
jgi:hypothetical protein